MKLFSRLTIACIVMGVSLIFLLSRFTETSLNRISLSDFFSSHVNTAFSFHVGDSADFLSFIPTHDQEIACGYAEHGSSATENAVEIVTENEVTHVDSASIRLFVIPENEVYCLKPNRAYYGYIATETMPLPPGSPVGEETRIVLRVSDQPFNAQGKTTVQPSPRARGTY